MCVIVLGNTILFAFFSKCLFFLFGFSFFASLPGLPGLFRFSCFVGYKKDYAEEDIGGIAGVVAYTGDSWWLTGNYFY